jgi:hypothetical protein
MELSKERLVHVMFMDFSKYEYQFDPYDLVENMDDIFKILNKTSSQYNLDTMKTMLDGYLCIAGLKRNNVRNDYQSIISFAFDIQSKLTEFKAKRKSQSKRYFDLRIGLHSGLLLEGVVGLRTISSDIWEQYCSSCMLSSKKGGSDLICISESSLSYLDKSIYSLYTTIVEKDGVNLAVYQLSLYNDKANINMSDSISDDFSQAVSIITDFRISFISFILLSFFEFMIV